MWCRVVLFESLITKVIWNRMIIMGIDVYGRIWYPFS